MKLIDIKMFYQSDPLQVNVILIDSGHCAQSVIVACGTRVIRLFFQQDHRNQAWLNSFNQCASFYNMAFSAINYETSKTRW